MKQEERKDDGIIFSIRIRTGMVSMHAVYPYAYINNIVNIFVRPCS